MIKPVATPRNAATEMRALIGMKAKSAFCLVPSAKD